VTRARFIQLRPTGYGVLALDSRGVVWRAVDSGWEAFPDKRLPAGYTAKERKRRDEQAAKEEQARIDKREREWRALLNKLGRGSWVLLQGLPGAKPRWAVPDGANNSIRVYARPSDVGKTSEYGIYQAAAGFLAKYELKRK